MKSFTFAVLAASATARTVTEYECSWNNGETTERDSSSWWQFDEPCDKATTVYEHTYEMSELGYVAKPAIDEIKHVIEEAEEEFEKLEGEASWEIAKTVRDL